MAGCRAKSDASAVRGERDLSLAREERNWSLRVRAEGVRHFDGRK